MVLLYQPGVPGVLGVPVPGVPTGVPVSPGVPVSFLIILVYA